MGAIFEELIRRFAEQSNERSRRSCASASGGYGSCYRDALITEAVTGKLDVTRLSEQQMDESAHAAMEGEQPEVFSA